MDGCSYQIHIRYDSVISNLSSNQLVEEKEFLQRLSHASLLRVLFLLDTNF